MAAIEKIRRRSGLLVAIIGIALLVFVLEDLFQSQGRGTIPVAAVVDGEKIFAKDFDVRRDKDTRRKEQEKRNRGSQTDASLTNNERFNVNNSTLDNMIMEKIIHNEYEAAGFGFTADELYDQMTGVQTGKPHEWMSQIEGGAFLDTTGKVDKARVDQFLNEVLPSYPTNSEVYKWWVEDVQEGMKESRMSTKFDNIVKASYFLPTALAQKYYEKSNTKASAQIIALRYQNIPDSLVTITDADNKAYYNAHKSEFKTDELRDIEYVIFDVKPSEEDANKARADLQALREGFCNAENVEGYLMAQKAERYDSTWLGRKRVPQQIEKVIFDNGNGIGYVTEVFENNGSFMMARIMDTQSRYDSLWACHILIPFVGCANNQDTLSKEQAQAKANALLAQLKSNSKDQELFAKLAKENSSDPGSKDNGGEYKWFTDGSMVPEFNEFVQKNPVGTLGIVETVYGFHIIKVMGKADLQPKVRLAYMTNPIIASEITKQMLYQEAREFAANHNTYEQFNKAIEEQGLTKRTWQRIKKSDYRLPGTDVIAREIVRWAFVDGKKGEIKDFDFLNDNDMVVVTALTGIVNEGYKPLEVVAEQEMEKIRNKKKGEMAVEKLKACGNDVNRMITDCKAETVPVSDLSFDSKRLSNFADEEKIIGIILGMKEGEEVGPIAGNLCAYIIKDVKIEQPAPTTDYSEVISKQVDNFNRQSVYTALKNLAKIKDNRTQLF